MHFFSKALNYVLSLIQGPARIHTEAVGNQDLLRIEQCLQSITQQLEELRVKASADQSFEPVTDESSGNGSADKRPAQTRLNFSELYSAVEQRFENQFLQFESLLSIYNSLPDLKVLPPTRGWAGSPDFLAKIIEVILRAKPQFVLEAGSGASTVVIGLALKQNARGRSLSLDHEEQFAAKTNEYLELNETGGVCQVAYRPLREYTGFEHNRKWYDTQDLGLAEKIDLLVIDGPPGSIGSLARYPAIPLLHTHFADKTLVLLDDSNRADEIIVVQEWTAFLEHNNYQVAVTRYDKFEKGMVILEVRRLS